MSAAIALRAIAAYYATRDLELRVDGIASLPPRGAALLAVRHYHHLYDGVALVRGLPRLPRIFVALDWARTPAQRFLMETLCKLAEWPVSLRSENVTGPGAFAPSETLRYVRRSIAAAAKLLGQGKVLAVFPEAYPTIDPAGSRKADDAAFLPFRPGLLAIVAAAERAGAAPVPILPVGLRYAREPGGRWEVTMRLGEPRYLSQAPSRQALLQELAARVRELSA